MDEICRNLKIIISFIERIKRYAHIREVRVDRKQITNY